MGSRISLSGNRTHSPPSRIGAGVYGLIFAVFLPIAAAADPAQGPAGTLLRLVPPDAAVVVTVEGLRDHANAFFKSPLANELARLPAVRSWLGSEKYRQLVQSRQRIETLLGVNLTVVRDELLGDAFVLALRLDPDAPADATQSRGLLLGRARDAALLKRVVRAVNTTQQESGQVAKVIERSRGVTAYYVREFPAALNRLPESYVAYPDGTFAASNSETMIQSVIDRIARMEGGKAGATADPNGDRGLGELPKVKAVLAKLPERALARLFIDPRQFERLLAPVPLPIVPGGARIVPMFERYLAAVEYTGAALTYNDASIMIHAVQTLKPALLDPWLRRWIGDTRRVDPTLANVPPTAVALGAGHIHFLALFDALSRLVPDEYQPQMANRENMLSGLLLGQDFRTKILPLVGPGIVAYLDSPSEPNEQAGEPGANRAAAAGLPMPLVVVISLGGNAEPVEAPAPMATALGAIDNALRTLLAIAAMDNHRAEGRSRLITRVVAGTAMTTLDRSIPFAYAIDRVRHRLVLSTSPAAVARYLEHIANPKVESSFSRLRANTFPGAATFGCIDFDAIDQVAKKHQNRLVRILADRQKRSVEEVERDLSQALALARLFRAGFITNRFEADATAVYQSFGLIQRQGPEN